ncbi:SDR family NAD(P)-dependent oxidoreductase [Vibrio hangzhouensis]|uniref:SDR family NAD(P)-dependent oxidoreductase n=1 Tax=Vibrio hangzhouensis TaxID=462991 RepID=UPI001C95AB6B|nr:SDR family oxidoreductase [Vibrio hangzhouensis]MBY6197359.1 SDR family oxidoreductase [Vibrio hangzhouensis]
MFSIEGKNALVTGGSSGIGLAIVERFIKAGANVVVVDLNTNHKLMELNVEVIEANVADEDSVARSFREAEAKLGKLDIVINNAGIYLEDGPLETLNTELFDQTLSVNLKGVLFGLKYAPAYMNDGGSIINTASLAANVSLPEYTAYSVSKVGVVKLTEQAALELGARNIRVNAVCPGTTVTPMEPSDSDESIMCGYLTALGRPGLPEEQAAVYHFLASNDSSYLNAQAIYVDGGWVHGMTYRGAEKLQSAPR